MLIEVIKLCFTKSSRGGSGREVGREGDRGREGGSELPLRANMCLEVWKSEYFRPTVGKRSINANR